MTAQEHRLLVENNAMLKELLSYIATKDNYSPIREFLINYVANKVADIY